MTRDIYGNLTEWFPILSNKIFFTTTDQLERNLKQQPKLNHIFGIFLFHIKTENLGFWGLFTFYLKGHSAGQINEFSNFDSIVSCHQQCTIVQWMKTHCWKNRLWTALVISTMLLCAMKLSRAVIMIKWETSPIGGHMKIIIIATKLVVKRMTPANGFFDQRI